MAGILTSYTYRGSVLDPEVDLDTYIEHVVKALISAARDTIPVSKPSVGTKPFWTPQLTQLSRHEYAVWRHWVAAGRPRDHENELWTQYKTAKRDFRRSMRQSELQYEQSAIDELVQAEQIDHRFFWYLVNKAAKGSKTRCSRIQPTRAPDGNIVYDPQHINDSWEKYYEELFKPMSKPQYDAANQQMVNDTINNLPNTYFDNTVPCHYMSPSDVEDKCKKLRCRKAAGWDGVFGEHLKHGGTNLYKALQVLYNTIIHRKIYRVILGRR